MTPTPEEKKPGAEVVKVETPTEVVAKTTPKTPVDIFKRDLFANYWKTIKNSLWDKWQIKFMWSCSYLVQTTPKLLDCKRSSLLNAIMQAFELGLNIGPSGEAYILPYWDKAQFQVWYKWIVKLTYWAGIQSIRSEIVYKNDEFNNVNWVINHKIDIFKSAKDRWEPIWCYVIAKYKWEEISKAMNIDDIMKFKTFSKSANAKEQWQRDSSPWDQKNDPELNMWKKTVLKQLAKMLPQNEQLVKAIEIDNEDSTVWDKRLNEMSSSDVVAKSLEWFWAAEEGEKKAIS